MYVHGATLHKACMPSSAWHALDDAKWSPNQVLWLKLSRSDLCCSKMQLACSSAAGMSHVQACTRSSSPYWHDGYCAVDLLRQSAPARSAGWSKQTLQSVSRYHGTVLPESRHQPWTRARGIRLQQHPDRLGQPQGQAAATVVHSKRSTRLPHIHIYLHKPAGHAIPTASSVKSDLVLQSCLHSVQGGSPAALRAATPPQTDLSWCPRAIVMLSAVLHDQQRSRDSHPSHLQRYAPSEVPTTT